MSESEDVTKTAIDLMKKFDRPVTRRQALLTFGALIGLPAAGAGYSIGVEPKRVTVENVDIALKEFPGTMAAVQISDLHMHGPSAFMERVKERINSCNADFIFVTGDLVEDEKELPPCLEFLSGLHCKKSVFFVPGNWEHWSETWERGLRPKLEKIGLEVLFNDGREISWGDGRFFLAGVDDVLFGNSRHEAALRHRQENLCTILLSHAPIIVNRLEGHRVDLVVAGHTHGGQIRLPFIGALTTPPGSGPYEQGLYRLPHTLLYINRGIGLSLIPGRFMCPPEITRFTLHGA